MKGWFASTKHILFPPLISHLDLRLGPKAEYKIIITLLETIKPQYPPDISREPLVSQHTKPTCLKPPYNLLLSPQPPINKLMHPPTYRCHNNHKTALT